MYDLLDADFNKRIRVIRAHLKSEDLSAVEQEAHYMRGAAGAYGLVALEKKIKSVELLCLKNDSDELISSIDELASLISTSLSALSARLKSYDQ